MGNEEVVHWPSAAVSHFEKQHDITVLEMRDFGSRSKSMDGPNSDTDAMFIFDQPALSHKTLGEYVDTINTKEYGVDFHGWNIRKFADLLSDSNPQAIEFLNSDIHYHTRYAGKDRIQDAFEELRLSVNRNFNPIRLYMHYRSMAKKQYQKYILPKLIDKHTAERYEILEAVDGAYVCKSLNGRDGLFHIRSDNERFRETTTDRTIGRYLKPVRAALYARHIRRTMQLPEMSFESFLKHSVAREIEEKATDLLLMKSDGLGDTLTTGPLDDIIEYEYTREPDYEALNQRGITRTRVNRFLEEIDGIVYG